MKQTLAIAFNGGSYGTYLEWALTSLTENQTLSAPFVTSGLTQGTSHLFVGHHLVNMQGWQDYVNSKNEYPTVRVHPKVYAHESVTHSLDVMLGQTKQVVLLYPDANSELLCLNNFYQKIKDDWWRWQLNTELDANMIYKNWPVESSTPIDNIPVWIRREFLSYYLVPAWRSQVEWFLPDNWQHPRCLVVYVSDLLHDFNNCVNRVVQFSQRDTIRSVDQLAQYHAKMLDLQLNISQDQLCQQIVKSVTGQHKHFNWQEQTIPLASQAWIQWQLRNLGYEIACHELDEWPQSSQALTDIMLNN